MRRWSLLMTALLVPFIGGCGLNFSKGQGSLAKLESSWSLSIFDSSGSHQVGMTNPLRNTGPAEIVACKQIDTGPQTTEIGGYQNRLMPDTTKNTPKLWRAWNEKTRQIEYIPWDELPPRTQRAYSSAQAMPQTW